MPRRRTAERLLGLLRQLAEEGVTDEEVAFLLRERDEELAETTPDAAALSGLVDRLLVIDDDPDPTPADLQEVARASLAQLWVLAPAAWELARVWRRG